MPCSKGMKDCRSGCLHRALISDYRDARINWEENRENGENMQLEDDEYRERHPPPTLKKWLESNKGKL